MGAVGHHTHHIAPLRPANERVNAIEQIVRASEFSNRHRARMDHHPFKRLDYRQFAATVGWFTYDLQVTTAVIEEFGKPHLPTVTGQSVLPVSRSATVGTRAAIHGTVFFNQFGWNDPHDGTGRSLYLQSRHKRGVLAEIIHGHTWSQLGDVGRLKYTEGANRQRSARKPL